MSRLPPRALSEVGDDHAARRQARARCLRRSGRDRRRVARRSTSRSAPGLREGASTSTIASSICSTSSDAAAAVSAAKPAAPVSIRSTCATRRSSAIAASFSAAWARRARAGEPAAQGGAYKTLGDPGRRRDSPARPARRRRRRLARLGHDRRRPRLSHERRRHPSAARDPRTSIDEMIVVPLPHWRGPATCFI